VRRSQAHQEWEGARARRLDEFEEVHRRVGAVARGRRYFTSQLDRGYLLGIAAEFQGFCRDLHSEATAAIIATLPVAARPVVAENFNHRRALDSGNPRAGNLGSDFGRLDIELWPDLNRKLRGGRERQVKLEQVMIWRNSIAHQAPIATADLQKIGTTKPTLQQVKRWRKNFDVLARNFDEIARRGVRNITGANPW